MGAEALNALIERLRAIPSLGPVIAREAAPAVLAAAQATADAGTTPEGEAWAPRKSDGARALAKASSALSVRVDEDVIVLVLSGTYVYAQRTRRILPGVGLGIPPRITAIITAKAREVLARAS